jgi:TRAP-type C4-dicarboxylate transport system permease small subunit
MMLVAAACIALMMLATIADVLMNNIFRRPIRGTFEFVEILMACTVFLGLPEIFRTNGNVVVDVLDHFLQSKDDCDA